MSGEKSGRNFIFYFYPSLFIAANALFIGMVLFLFYASMQPPHLLEDTVNTSPYRQIASWFDPIFFNITWYCWFSLSGLFH